MQTPLLRIRLLFRSTFFKMPALWCLLLPLSGFAQTISLELCALDHPSLTKSLVTVSTQKGIPVFERILSDDEIYNGSSFIIPVDIEEKHMLTIINQYTVDSLNAGEPFYQAVSYCEIDQHINVLRFQHPKPWAFHHDKHINMEIINCPELEVFRVHAAGHMKHFKKVNPGNKLWLQVNYGPEEDIYIMFKSKVDSKYKYIYIEAAEIANRDRYNYLTFDWKHLPSDLIQVDIKSPFTQLKSGYIRGTNTKTKNTCYFFRVDSLLELTTDLKLLFPSRITFENIQTQLEFIANTYSEKYYYTYVICHGAAIELPRHDPESFTIADYRIDSTSLNGRLPRLPEYYKVTYTMSPSQQIKVGTKLYHYRSSTWEVYGKNNHSIDITLPQFSQNSITNFFDSAYPERHWWLRHTELIKVTEKEYGDIEWVNFLNDYNLLYVQPLTN